MLNIFYHRSTAIVFRTVLFLILYIDCGNFYFLKKIFSKSPSIYVFLIQKLVIHNSGMNGHRMLSDASWKLLLMFCRLFYNIRSFKWQYIGLKGLFTIMSKVLYLRFKASVWNIPISETGRNCNSLFKLFDNNWVVILKQKRRMEYNWARTVRSSQGFSKFQDFLGRRKISF